MSLFGSDLDTEESLEECLAESPSALLAPRSHRPRCTFHSLYDSYYFRPMPASRTASAVLDASAPLREQTGGLPTSRGCGLIIFPCRLGGQK